MENTASDINEPPAKERVPENRQGSSVQKYLPYLLLAAECAGLLAWILSLLRTALVDLRNQTVFLYSGLSAANRIQAVGILLFAAVFFYRIQPDKKVLSVSALPLAGLLIFFFVPVSFPLLFAGIFLTALAAARIAAESTQKLPEIPQKKAWIILGCTVIVYAVFCALMQSYSLSKSALQWLDWGHYFEMLNNFSKARPFELNLSGGSFLGSRFCPGLIVLLPVVLLQNTFLFFLCGTLAAASGAFAVFLLARQSRSTNTQSLLYAFWYLLIPGVANICLPLLDGFHEIMLLFPGVLFAAVCYRSCRYKTALLLMLFCFTVRETAGFMFFLYGIVLFFNGDRRRGVAVSAISLVLLILIIGVLMPFFRQGNTPYEHVNFFQHLGNSIPEIALSPFLKSKVFFSSLFSVRNLLYLVSLLLPFLFLIRKNILFLIPMLPDLVMVMLDRRIDSQTLLRHYQVVMLLVLIIASMHSLKHIRCRKTALAGSLTAAGLSFLLFVQLPVLPAGDKRLLEWENTSSIIETFRQKIPENAVLLAGPRLASHFVMRNDLFIISSLAPGIPEKAQFCLLESFESFHGENRVRRTLLQSGRWELLHSELAGQRLMQLYQKRGTPLPPLRLPETSPDAFARLGSPIPSADPAISLRGNVSGKELLIFCRIGKKLEEDFALLIDLVFASGKRSEYFFPCGGGRVPGYLVLPGGTWHAAIPLDEAPVKCTVSLVR